MANRAVRWILEKSGYDPDALQFTGLYGPVINVKAFGALGDGANDDTAAIASAVSVAMAQNCVLFFPKTSAYYTSTAAINITNSCIVRGHNRSEIRFSGVNSKGFYVTSSNVTFRDLKITGRQYVSGANTEERGIYVVGSSSASYLSNVRVIDCDVNTWGYFGVFMQFVDKYAVRNSDISNIQYAGVGIVSCSRGKVLDNHVKNVVANPNAYGIFFSRVTHDSLVTHPRSKDALCRGNLIEDVTYWEGLDTHGGDGIRFVDNTILRCYLGINIGPAPGTTSTVGYAPHNCCAKGNYVDSEKTDGTADRALTLAGMTQTGVPGSPIEYATGLVSMGNTFRRHGLQGVSTGGAVYVESTRGLVMRGDQIIEPSPAGVNLQNDNQNFCIDVTVTDVWSNSVSVCSAVWVNTVYNTGRITGSLGTGTKSAVTHLNKIGVQIASVANVSIKIGADHNFFAATDYVILDGSRRGVSSLPLMVSADKGNVASLTLTPGVDPNIIRFSTALTQHCAVTIPTTAPASTREWFIICHEAASAFNVVVNGSLTIPSGSRWMIAQDNTTWIRVL